MKLTGKCKEEFIFWMCKNHEYVRWHEYETMPECALNALIIDWFDLVGIYITVLPCIDGTFDSYVRINLIRNDASQFQETRQKATNAALTKANEIFNLNNQK